jgi:demethylmenaquinone methyltransferase / 2-methoxy-6-polyprenyl-1,4-benzoquinol methylase
MNPNAEKIQTMFSDIAHNYDKSNAILSLGIYGLWYKKLIKIAHLENYSKILDLATGTGNLAIAFKKANNTLNVTGIDFSQKMLEFAKERCSKFNLEIKWETGDALNLPFGDKYFDLATICYGIRNVESIEKCLSEMARVVKKSGRILILEFGTPYGIMKPIFKLYSKIIIRNIGGLISGNKKAYHYLNQSSLEFPYASEFIKIMSGMCLFDEVQYYPLNNGIAYIYSAIVK